MIALIWAGIIAIITLDIVVLLLVVLNIFALLGMASLGGIAASLIRVFIGIAVMLTLHYFYNKLQEKKRKLKIAL